MISRFNESILLSECRKNINRRDKWRFISLLWHSYPFCRSSLLEWVKTDKTEIVRFTSKVTCTLMATITEKMWNESVGRTTRHFSLKRENLVVKFQITHNYTTNKISNSINAINAEIPNCNRSIMIVQLQWRC